MIIANCEHHKEPASSHGDWLQSWKPWSLSNDSLPTNPMIYRSKINPDLVVTWISEAQLRIGETKRLCVIYKRDEYYYVRPKVEFFEKFKLDEPQISD